MATLFLIFALILPPSLLFLCIPITLSIIPTVFYSPSPNKRFELAKKKKLKELRNLKKNIAAKNP